MNKFKVNDKVIFDDPDDRAKGTVIENYKDGYYFIQWDDGTSGEFHVSTLLHSHNPNDLFKNIL